MTAKNNQEGFTIAELLIASVIIAVGILGWSKTQTGAMKSRAVSNGITTASELAVAKIEDLGLELQNSDAANSSDSPSVQGVTYNRSWDIQREQSTSNSTTEIWKIQVTVNWNHFGQRTLQYERIVVSD